MPELPPQLPVGDADNMTVSWRGRLRAVGAAGVNSMMAVLLIAGIGFLLAGLLAIGFGIPVKEFSFGNTLILTGAIVACTGMMMLGLWMVVRELKDIARRLGPAISPESHAGNILQSAAAGTAGNQASESAGFLFSRDQPAAANAGNGEAAAQSPPPPPWHEERVARSRAVRARACRGRPSCQAAAQSAVFLVIAEGTRARPGANGRPICG